MEFQFQVSVGNEAITITPRPTNWNYLLSINADLYSGWASFTRSNADTVYVEETSY